MQHATFSRWPLVHDRARPINRSSARRIRVGESGTGFIKPLPRGDNVLDSDKTATLHELVVCALGTLAGADCAPVEFCPDPEALEYFPDHPACVSIAPYASSLSMQDIVKTDLREAGKQVRRTLRRKVAADYVFRCWTGDRDRGDGAMQFEMADGKLTGECYGYDAAMAFGEDEKHLRVDIGEWPDFFADAALEDDAYAVAGRRAMAENIISIPREKIAAIFEKLPPGLVKPRRAEAMVDYLVRRQKMIKQTFLGKN